MQEYQLAHVAQAAASAVGPLGDDPALERSAVCALAGSGVRDGGAAARGLEVDTFQGSAWLGVVPFWLDRIKIRGVPPIPGARSFPDLNLRTYVRDQYTGTPGVYLLLAGCQQPAGGGRRRAPSIICPTTGPRCGWSSARSGSLPSTAGGDFKPAGGFQGALPGTGTERADWRRAAAARSSTFSPSAIACLARNRAGQPIRANLHHVPWPLEEAEAEIERNDLAASIGLTLPKQEPVLHYSRRLAVYMWPAENWCAPRWSAAR